MESVVATPEGLTCVPQAIAAAERAPHFALARRLLLELATDREELLNGYSFRFAADDYDMLAGFIANERKCCPFIAFEIRIPSHAELIVLRMTGPPGTREVLEAELGVSRSCGCSAQVDREAVASIATKSMGVKRRSRNRFIGWMAAGGVLASIGVCAACCLLPFVLLSLGVTGAWVSNMDALGHYRWLFVAMSAAMLGYGFYEAYRKPADESDARMGRHSRRRIRTSLWVGAALAMAGVVFSFVEPYL